MIRKLRIKLARWILPVDVKIQESETFATGTMVRILAYQNEDAFLRLTGN